jgi:hypothetical protein
MVVELSGRLWVGSLNEHECRGCLLSVISTR